MLEQALGASEYELGGHLALGCCHQAKGDIARAVQHLLAALKGIDLTTVAGGRVEQLSLLYDNLVHSYSVGGQPDHAPEFAASMVQFISKSGWQERATHARRRLDEVAQDGPPMTLADLLAPPGTEETLALLELIQSHIARDLLYTALEECYIVIGGCRPTCPSIASWRRSCCVWASGRRFPPSSLLSVTHTTSEGSYTRPQKCTVVL